MQWLIDIITDWIIAQGYLTQSYFYRGDPAAIDFQIGDFVVDNAWHALDLSAIIPEGAKAVSLLTNLENTAVSRRMTLRRNGQVNVRNTCSIWTQVANILLGGVFTIPLCTDRKIEYRFSVGGWVAINFTVCGWWF